MKKQILLLVSVLISFSAFAQNDTVDVFDMSLEELMNVKVVSASKSTQKLSDAPSVISVVSRKEIQNMAVTSLIDVLKFMPAIEVSMSPTGFYRVSIRGERKKGNIKWEEIKAKKEWIKQME